MAPLLDACTISYLFSAGQKDFLREAAAIWPIHTTALVVDEGDRETTWGPGFKKLREELVGSGKWVVHELIIDTPEERLLKRLRQSRNKLKERDQGELESIALAAFRPDLVFVTEDRNAMKWAIDELPGFSGRVVRTAAWLRAVHAQGARLELGGLERWARVVPRPLPFWWSDWVTEQLPQSTSL